MYFEQAEMETVGSARTVSQALELLKSKGFDAAILDVNLGEETSELSCGSAPRIDPYVTVRRSPSAACPQADSAHLW